MAGSYGHIVGKDGNLRDYITVDQMLENGGDVFECVEEMYGMIWYLAGQHAFGRERAAVEDARKNYREGLKKAKEING